MRARSAVVSHAFWQGRLGGGESAIGGTVTLQDQLFTVVGSTSHRSPAWKWARHSMSLCRSVRLRSSTGALTAGIGGG